MKSDITLTVNSYWKLLSHLSNEVKLKLISKLSDSLVQSYSEEEDLNWADEFYGKWEDSRTVEEIIEQTREQHVYNRKITSFNS